MAEELPVLEGRLVRLRPLRESDAPGLFSYYRDPEVTRHLDWYGPASPEEALRAIRIWRRGYEEGWIRRFAVAETGTDAICGTAFLNHAEGKRCEVGYELGRAWWCRGYMTEALGLLLGYAFGGMGMERVQAAVAPDNVASRALLLGLGFRKEGLLRRYETHEVTGRTKDMEMWALLGEERPDRGAT